MTGMLRSFLDAISASFQTRVKEEEDIPLMTLVYFDVEGIAQSIRDTFRTTETEFVDMRVDRRS